jgi:hypothetical protein
MGVRVRNALLFGWWRVPVLAICLAALAGAGSPVRALGSDLRVEGATLTVTEQGTGSGTVTSSPAGIDCGSTCSSSFGYGTTVTLTATAATGSMFASWSDSCPTPRTASCKFTMDQAQDVTATFNTIPEVVEVYQRGSRTVSLNPAGTPTANPCSASFTCYTYPYGTSVTVTATPATGFAFRGWFGSCSGTAPCNLNLNQSGRLNLYNVGASFGQLVALTITKSGTGTGLVSTVDGGISCGSICSHFYDPGTSVTVTATPAAGSTFAGWGDSCPVGLCVLLLQTDYTVTAAFAKIVCVVPNVRGKPLSAAKSVIRHAHCGVGTVTKAFSPTTARGKVLSQSPRRGKRLKAGAPVALLVSKGKRP